MSINRQKLKMASDDHVTDNQLGGEYYKDAQSLSHTIKHENENNFLAMAGSSAFFAYFITTRSMTQFLSHTFGRVLLPLMAISSLVNMGLRWKEYFLEKKIQGKSSTLPTAVVDTLIDLGIVVAVAGSLIAQAAFVVLSPAIIVAAVGLKSLFEIGMGISKFVEWNNLRKVPTSSDLTDARKIELWQEARNHLRYGVVAAVITTALGLMAFAGLAAMAYMGLAASIAGVASVALNHTNSSTVSVVDLHDTGLGQPLMTENTTANIHKNLHSHGMPFQRSIVKGTQYGHLHNEDVQTVVLDDETRSQAPVHHNAAKQNYNITHIDENLNDARIDDYRPSYKRM